VGGGVLASLVKRKGLNAGKVFLPTRTVSEALAGRGEEEGARHRGERREFGKRPGGSEKTGDPPSL